MGEKLSIDDVNMRRVANHVDISHQTATISDIPCVEIQNMDFAASCKGFQYHGVVAFFLGGNQEKRINAEWNAGSLRSRAFNKSISLRFHTEVTGARPGASRMQE